MKSFSIVLTYFKQPGKLSQALYCLMQQTYTKFEVIPIFDGRDSQAEFTYKQFCARTGDKRFRPAVIFEEGKREHFGNDARHAAMAYCHNDYVVWYGHDCLIDKDYLQTHAELISDGWCVSVVSQAHFTWHDHNLKWLTYRENLPRPDVFNPDMIYMQNIDLLNFALPTHEALKWAWALEHRDKYEADWYSFRDTVLNSGLTIRLSPKIVCAHF